MQLPTARSRDTVHLQRESAAILPRMHHMRALLFFSVAFTFATTLHAQECAADADCPDGYACTSFAEGCPACDPASGAECPPCDSTGTVTYCEIVVEACTADADCADGLVCVHFTGEACAGGTVCPDGDPNCVSEPGACETVDETQCAPPWIASCEVDADCGPGFLCVALASPEPSPRRSSSPASAWTSCSWTTGSRTALGQRRPVRSRPAGPALAS